uniref:MH2 domain-containing protein n=1 Tax=Rhabditophanes sp. KR3021 TaxID=114890 RepID=A0AC35TJG8_9BILA
MATTSCTKHITRQMENIEISHPTCEAQVWKQLGKQLINVKIRGNVTERDYEDLRVFIQILKMSNANIFSLLKLIEERNVQDCFIIHNPLIDDLANHYNPFFWSYKLFIDPQVREIFQLYGSEPSCKKPFYMGCTEQCISPFHYETVVGFKELGQYKHILENMDGNIYIPGIQDVILKSAIFNKIQNYGNGNSHFRNTTDVHYIRTPVLQIVSILPAYSSRTYMLAKSETSTTFNRKYVNSKITYGDIYGLNKLNRDQQLVILKAAFGKNLTKYPEAKLQIDFFSYSSNKGWYMKTKEIDGPGTDFHYFTSNLSMCSVYFYEYGRYVGQYNSKIHKKFQLSMEDTSDDRNQVNLGDFLLSMTSENKDDMLTKLSGGFSFEDSHGDVFFKNNTKSTLYMQCLSYNFRRNVNAIDVVGVMPGTEFCCQSFGQLSEIVRLNNNDDNFMCPSVIDKLCTIRTSFWHQIGDGKDHQTMASAPFFIEIQFNNAAEMSKNHMHYCLTKSKLITDERLRTPCAIHEGQCMMVVQLVNGLITDIERDCVSSCSQQCFETGYGLTIKRCIRCCDTNLCNDFHIYDMDPLDVDPYKIKPSSGTTSSIPYFLYLLPLFSCCYLN